MNNYPRAVDAIPSHIMSPFLAHAKQRGEFWYDMLYLCAALGLRNSECRELKCSHNHLLHLSDSKNVRSFITRKANQHFDEHWIGIARRWLREHVRDRHIGLIVRLASTPEMLEELAHEYGLKILPTLSPTPL